MSVLFRSPSEATIRLLPTTSAKDCAARLVRLNCGQCHNLVLTGIRGGTWNLAEFCSVIEAATHLAPQITTLDFSKMDLDETFLMFAIDLVNRCPNLKRLEMEENFFSEDAARELGRALSTKPQLKYVNLTRCQLTDKAAEFFISSLLRQNSGGEKAPKTFFSDACGISLHLPHNSLTSAFARSLTEIISDPEVHHLNTISLFGNFITNDESRKVHVACQQRRLAYEAKRKGAAMGGDTSLAKKAAPRTSLGLLVGLADASEKNAFPTVVAMSRMLTEEEGL